MIQGLVELIKRQGLVWMGKVVGPSCLEKAFILLANFGPDLMRDGLQKLIQEL
jgi:hypothetical protein